MKYVCPLIDIIEERLETVPREPLMWTYRLSIAFRVCSTVLTMLLKEYYFDN